MLLAEMARTTRTLYVSRPVLNGWQVRQWAKEQGFSTKVPDEKLHVTIAYSKAPVCWDDIEESPDRSVVLVGGHRSVERFGDDAVVIRIESAELQDRWQEFRDAGCSWDFPDYKPHVSFTFNGGEKDLSDVQPYVGPIVLGQEEFEELKGGWSEEIAEERLDEGLTEGLIKVPQETLGAAVDFVERQIVRNLRDRFTAKVRARFPEHFAEVSRWAEKLDLGPQRHVMPANGIEAKTVPFPGVEGGVRVALDWQGKALRPKSAGSGRVAAGWHPSKRVMILYLSDLAELVAFPDGRHGPDAVPYILRSLREKMIHELRHAVQDLALHPDQRQRQVGYGAHGDAYYKSPAEFDPQIGSAVDEFIEYVRLANPSAPKLRRLMGQFVGAAKGNPLGGLSTNDFFAALKSGAPQRWKTAVRKFSTEFSRQIKEGVYKRGGVDHDARSFGIWLGNSLWDQFHPGKEPGIHNFEYLDNERGALRYRMIVDDEFLAFIKGEAAEAIREQGWHLTTATKKGTQRGKTFHQVVFEPLLTAPVPRTAVFWHITPKDNVESIMRDGLRPSASRHGFSYPQPRIYLIRSREHAQRMADSLGKRDPEKLRYSLLRVDLRSAKGVRLHTDPELKDVAVYTTEPVPPTLLAVVEPEVKPLWESPQSDLEASRMANRAYTMVANEVQKAVAGEGLPWMEADIDGDGQDERFAWYPVSRLLRSWELAKNPLPTGFPDLATWIVAFVPETAVRAKGFYTKMSLPSRGETHIIAIATPPERFPTSLRARETFRHEFTHMMDELRLKNPAYAASYDPNAYPSEETLRAYFSNPVEFNAIFHDFADPVVTLIDDIAAAPDEVDDLLDLYGWKPFAEYVAERVRGVRKFQMFFRYADETWQRKFMRRFAKLYAEVETMARGARTNRRIPA